METEQRMTPQQLVEFKQMAIAKQTAYSNKWKNRDKEIYKKPMGDIPNGGFNGS